jgi:hypothetical protein
MEKNLYSNSRNVDKLLYEKMVKQTGNKVFEMKTRVKDKNGLIRNIEEQTGGMNCIDNFFRKQEDNLVLLETLLTKRHGTHHKQ